METPVKDNKMDVAEISFAEIFAFFRKNAKKLAFFAAGSLILAVLLILIVYCFTPRVRSYQKTISLNLAYKDGAFCYPSRKKFSSADLISRPVLRKVYNEIGLGKQVPFEDFVRSFFIAQTSMKKAFLDAQFKAKMNVRNINMVQLQQLERDYREALAAVKSSQVIIAMEPDFACNSVLAARILNAIPTAWFDIYSVQEAAHYPTPVPAQQIQGLARSIGQEGQLILLEKCRLYCRQMQQLCSFLNEMLQGRNIMLPTGESLGDLQTRLDMLARHQINVLQLYVLEHPEYYGVFDRVFLESRVKNMEFEHLRMQGRYDGVLAAMNTLIADGTGQNAGNAPASIQDKRFGGSAASASNAAPVTLQLDAGFFSSIAQLIRNDINSDIRRSLAEKIMSYREELADLEAELKRYQDILDIVNGKKNSKSQGAISKDKFYGLVREMIADLFVLCNKVQQFRTLLLQEEHTSRQFCTQDSEVRAASSAMIPISRVALGILAVWALANCGFVFFQFQARKKD